MSPGSGSPGSGSSGSGSSGSGPASDPHLLALLRAIRLRQNAPDAAAAGAAGAADTAAALSELSGRKPESGSETELHDDSGKPEQKAGPKLPYSERRAGYRARPAPPVPPPGPAPSERGTADLLWRGDPGATLGRAGLEARKPRRDDTPGRPAPGVNPAGPAVPVPNIPPIEGLRPIGGAGTEFPTIQPIPYIPRPPAAKPVRPQSPSDGMDPADDAALRDTQRLLSTSLTFAGGTEEVAERLWHALLRAQPDLLAALPGTPETQRNQLARAITWLVHTIGDPPALVAGCGQLGAALAACGVQWKQLQLVGAALAEAMRAGMAPGGWRQDFDQAWRWTWQHTYEWIVHGGTLASYQPAPWAAEVVTHELRRPDLAVIRLRPYLPMPFRPGQFARIEVPAVPGVWRPYSLATTLDDDEIVELHVRAKSETGVSGTLVYDTLPGDQLRIARAEGTMSLPAQPGRGILMIAGDTGVAPMKAMLTELATAADPRPAVLFWGVRDLPELYDIEELSEIARAAPRATVVPVIADGNPGPYAYGLVTDAVAAYGEWSRHEVYLAGPPLMLAATSAALLQLGVDATRIHHDVPE
ncbi:flavohemoprotein [Actinoplanes sp. GCM10030250]|uniref:flavohemoprotein n=1 Tax=Actinoplanes sp. GCM10030250 TaxID=3273376 RepID=UPI003616A2A2